VFAAPKNFTILLKKIDGDALFLAAVELLIRKRLHFSGRKIGPLLFSYIGARI
jgi:hypothetical protein